MTKYEVDENGLVYVAKQLSLAAEDIKPTLFGGQFDALVTYFIETDLDMNAVNALFLSYRYSLPLFMLCLCLHSYPTPSNLHPNLNPSSNPNPILHRTHHLTLPPPLTSPP